jgi:hypothetical protein
MGLSFDLPDSGVYSDIESFITMSLFGECEQTECIASIKKAISNEWVSMLSTSEIATSPIRGFLAMTRLLDKISHALLVTRTMCKLRGKPAMNDLRLPYHIVIR